MKRNNDDDTALQGSSPLSGTTTIESSSAPSSSAKSCSYQNSTVTVSDTEESILIASPSMCYHCFDTLIDTLQHPNTTNNSNNNIVTPTSSSCNNQHKRTNASTTIPDFVSHDLPDGVAVECPLFVTWESSNQSNRHHRNRTHHRWQLRGCIGTLTPKLLSTAVGEYAVISALRDKRFRPIELQEVSSLRVSISLLVQYEECQDVYDWTVGVHGIVIKFAVHHHHHHPHNYNATYLPEVAAQQGWDQSQTIESLIQKAGYHGTVDADLLKTIHCTRYQSSKCQVTFDEYVEHNCHGNDPLLPPPRPHHRPRPSTSSWTSTSCINM
jgi:AMME syndrome candidate gene 1 protein